MLINNIISDKYDLKFEIPQGYVLVMFPLFLIYIRPWSFSIYNLKFRVYVDYIILYQAMLSIKSNNSSLINFNNEMRNSVIDNNILRNIEY